MPRTAQEFLTSWRQSRIYGEARPPEALDEAVAECVADGADEGLTRDALEKAAGGDLSGIAVLKALTSSLLMMMRNAGPAWGHVTAASPPARGSEPGILGGSGCVRCRHGALNQAPKLRRS